MPIAVREEQTEGDLRKRRTARDAGLVDGLVMPTMDHGGPRSRQETIQKMAEEAEISTDLESKETPLLKVSTT